MNKALVHLFGGIDTAKHVTFDYENWNDKRVELIRRIGPMTADNLVDLRLRSSANWDGMTEYVKYVISACFLQLARI